jgi:3-hydroxyacyl-[acyl-carrier-protein] dehydratase
MRYQLVDRLIDVDPGRQIRMVKALTLGEEYLADHFPTFPVMPGVLMLQTLVETAAWLLRLTDDYRHSVIVLREARNVKYGNLMEPGRRLVLTVEIAEAAVSPDQPLVTFKGKGEQEGLPTVSAKLTVARYNLADRDPRFKVIDEQIVAQLRARYLLLSGALSHSAKE